MAWGAKIQDLGCALKGSGFTVLDAGMLYFLFDGLGFNV